MGQCAGLFFGLATAAMLLVSVADAAEFYSWIDPSGTMVMTDDPSHIPMSVSRSPVSIHRFDDLADSVTSQPLMHATTRTPSRQAAAGGADDVPVAKDRSMPGDAPSEVSAPDPDQLVLLEAPEERAGRDYLWVPLIAPVYLGATPVSGFWCHRSVSSPVDAFRMFLAQHGGMASQVLIAGGQLQLGNLFNRPRASPFSRHGTRTEITGTSVYDQVLREHRALLDRAAAPVQPAGTRPAQGLHRGFRGPGGQRAQGR